jgi:hypothetical protein
MSTGPQDYDDPAVEQQWCAEHRLHVIDYLRAEGINHGAVGNWPAWHVAPYVSIWAVESGTRPGFVGWWVICGDLPTDYVSAQSIKHPRDAMRAIAKRWLEQADLMMQGKSHPELRVGRPEDARTLAPLLNSRAAKLLAWSDDPLIWNEDTKS